MEFTEREVRIIRSALESAESEMFYSGLSEDVTREEIDSLLMKTGAKPVF